MRVVKRIGVLLSALMLGLGLSTNVLAAGELKGKTLTAVINPVGAPLAFLTDDLEHPQGIDVDIILELQKRLGFKLTENRIFPEAFTDGMERVRTGKADIMGGGVSYTVARTEKFDFSPIYYESSLALLYSKKYNPDIKTLIDIKGKTIGVQMGSTSEHYANMFHATPVIFNNVMLAYFQVARGKMDGIIFDRPEVADFARVMPALDLAITNDTFGADDCQFALLLTKDSPYREIIAYTMEQMFMDGTIDSIKNKWRAK